MPPDARERFLIRLRTAVREGHLVKLTLGRHRGADATLRNLLVRPVTLKAGPRLGFVWRHATRDVTKNHPPAEALALLEPLIGADFLDAHLFTPVEISQLEGQADGSARLHCTPAAGSPAGKASSARKSNPAGHDHYKSRLIAPDAGWLRALGVTRPDGRPCEGMAPKFRQIQKFAELLEPLLGEAGLAPGPDRLRSARLRSLNPPSPSYGGQAASYDAAKLPPALRAEAISNAISVTDMGSGKGYLTFAVSALLGDQARVRGVEVRPDLVELCNRVAREQGFGSRLEFTSGIIADTELDQVDVLIALHACDTATDDALAKGIAAGARLLVVAPCCQKEVRPQLASPPVLAAALRHGIFRERQAEFATDALRAQLLEWAGYRTKVFEFVSTEHTAKNLMIAAIKTSERKETAAQGIRQLAAFYGIKHQALARQLGFDISAGP